MTNVSLYVKQALNHYTAEAGRDTFDGLVAGVATGYLEAKGKLDYKVGSLNVPLDALGGVLAMVGAKFLPHDYELPLHAMSLGGDLLAIATHRKSAEFFGVKKTAAAAGDFGKGFGAEDPLLKAAAAL